MESFIPAIRLLHVLFGVFWVGTVFFNVLILEPRLAALGPRVVQPVMGAIAPRMVPTLIGASLVVLVTGSILTLHMKSGSLGSLLTTSWGTTIVVGLIATLAAMVIGFGVLTPIGIRMGRLGDEIGDQPPTREQMELLTRLRRRMDVAHRMDFALVLLAVATMPLARFV